MHVRVKFIGIPEAGIDRGGVAAEIPEGSTVEGMLISVMGDSKPYKTMNFIVNKSMASLETVLKENDEVMVLRVLAGG